MGLHSTKHTGIHLVTADKSIFWKLDVYQLEVKEKHMEQDKIVNQRMTESLPMWRGCRKRKKQVQTFTEYKKVLLPSTLYKVLVQARVEDFTYF